MQQQYPNPQSYIQPPQPPRSKIRPWMWIVGSVLVFVGVLIWLAISIGQNLGAKMQEGLDHVKHSADSISNVNDSLRNVTYETMLGIETGDSSYLAIQERVRRLQSNSNSIRELFLATKDSFARSLPDSSTLTMLNKKYGQSYFIASGRAAKLKSALEEYEAFCKRDLPNEVTVSNTTSVFSVNDLLQKTAPKPFKKFLSWENMYFDQPPTSVFMNFRLILQQVDQFEETLLDEYNLLPVPAPSDSTGTI